MLYNKYPFYNAKYYSNCILSIYPQYSQSRLILYAKYDNNSNDMEAQFKLVDLLIFIHILISHLCIKEHKISIAYVTI